MSNNPLYPHLYDHEVTVYNDQTTLQSKPSWKLRIPLATLPGGGPKYMGAGLKVSQFDIVQDDKMVELTHFPEAQSLSLQPWELGRVNCKWLCEH